MRRVAAPLVFAVLAVCAVLAAPARAGDADRAEALFAEGRYAEAAAACSAPSSADCWAVAARSTLAASYFETGKEPRIEAAKAAEAFARLALDADPDHVEGHIQLALALGRRGAALTPVKAYLLRLAPRARESVERALEIDPGDAWALSVMGGWHLEVVRRGGAGVYDASVSEGVEAFERAISADPENAAIRYQYAIMLAGLADPALEERASEVLRSAIDCEPRTAFEAALRDDAERAVAVFAGDRPTRQAFLDARL